MSKRLGIPFPVTKVRSYYDEIVDVLLDAVQNHELLSVDRILGLQEKIVEANPGVRRGAFGDDAVMSYPEVRRTPSSYTKYLFLPG